jgi:tRNA1Val (adenine37-N6)-methyltransferase
MDPWDAPKFTCDYSQPTDYHFSLDSILLAKAVVRDRQRAAVVRDTKNEPVLPNFRVLDLCAGAGIVGLEVAHLWPMVKIIDFVEIQSRYRKYFDENIQKSAALGVETRWREMNYADLLNAEDSEKYDLIVTNPPYFEKDQGLIPPNELKARSRFFLDSSFESLIEVILHTLKPQGEAYILTRDQKPHGQNRDKTLAKLIEGKAKIISAEILRSTTLTRLQKK